MNSCSARVRAPGFADDPRRAASSRTPRYRLDAGRPLITPLLRLRPRGGGPAAARLGRRSTSHATAASAEPSASCAIWRSSVSDQADQPRGQQDFDQSARRGTRRGRPAADGLASVGDQSEKETSHALLVLRRQRVVDRSAVHATAPLNATRTPGSPPPVSRLPSARRQVSARAWDSNGNDAGFSRQSCSNSSTSPGSRRSRPACTADS